jgi:hypothetical protein|eukprot:COSAG06_NODE_360_length_16832_cov_9.250209_10_plen_39_part_00
MKSDLTLEVGQVTTRPSKVTAHVIHSNQAVLNRQSSYS